MVFIFCRPYFAGGIDTKIVIVIILSSKPRQISYNVIRTFLIFIKEPDDIHFVDDGWSNDGTFQVNFRSEPSCHDTQI